MIIPVATPVLILSVRLFGGRLRRLAAVRLRWFPLLPLALSVQFLGLLAGIGVPFGRGSQPGDPVAGYVATGWHLATGGYLAVGGYLAIAAFASANRRVPGLPLIAVGAVASGVGGVLDGGVLLAALDGVLAVPAWMTTAAVVGFGDAVIVLGAGYTMYRICGSFRWTPWDAAAHGHGRRPHGRHRAAGRPAAEPVFTPALPEPSPEPVAAVPEPGLPALVALFPQSAPTVQEPVTAGTARIAGTARTAEPGPVATAVLGKRRSVIPRPRRSPAETHPVEPLSVAEATDARASDEPADHPPASTEPDGSTDPEVATESAGNRSTAAGDAGRPSLLGRPMALTITPRQGRLGPWFRSR